MKKSTTIINCSNVNMASILFNLGLNNSDSARIENRVFGQVSSSNDEYIRVCKNGWKS
jgi:hypothetical protein